MSGMQMLILSKLGGCQFLRVWKGYEKQQVFKWLRAYQTKMYVISRPETMKQNSACRDKALRQEVIVV